MRLSAGGKDDHRAIKSRRDILQFYKSADMSAILSEILPEEKRKLVEIEQQLVEIQGGKATHNIGRVLDSLKQFSNSLNSIDKLVEKEPKAKKDDYRRRVQHLRSTFSHLKSLADNLATRIGGEELKKNLLFGPPRPDSGHDSDIALELAENGSLSRSSQYVNEYLNIGKETLSELISQRERLKGIQRKALDMMNYLGISGNLLKSVEMRDNVDKWIVYTGMAIILLVLYIIWKYVRK